MQGAHAQNLATILLSLFNSAGGVSERCAWRTVYVLSTSESIMEFQDTKA